MSHYHDYKIIGENKEAVLEMCTECKHRITTKKDAVGRILDKNYLKEHVRDTAQPRGITGKVFKQYYAKK